MLSASGPLTPGPSSARLHNALAGGWNCTGADQAKVTELEAACPMIRQMVADSRLFTARVVSWAAAEQGIRQFIDLGAGLPPGEGVHEMARAVAPAARVAYVDLDAEVVDHIRDVTLDGGQEGVAVVRADLANPEAALSDPALVKVIDLGRPVLTLLALALHFLPPGAAEAVVREYAGRLAPGSLVAVSVPRIADAAMWRRLQDANPCRAWNHGAGDVGRFLGELEIIPPGIVPARGLRPGWEDAANCRNAPAFTLAGIGRKR